MASDDLTALATISMGALVSAALTLSLSLREPDAWDPGAVEVEHATGEPAEYAVPGRRTPVDYAIIRTDIRGDLQLTVGPERPSPGLHPEARGSSLEMRLLRSR